MQDSLLATGRHQRDTPPVVINFIFDSTPKNQSSIIRAANHQASVAWHDCRMMFVIKSHPSFLRGETG